MDAVSAKSRTCGLVTKELKNVIWAKETYKDTAPSEAVFKKRKKAEDKAFLNWQKDSDNEVLRDIYKELRAQLTEPDRVLVGMTSMYHETAPLDKGIGAPKRKREHSANWATWNEQVRIPGSDTQVMYFNSSAYQRMSNKRKADTPYAGALLPLVQGYQSLQSGLVLRASTSAPLPHNSQTPTCALPHRHHLQDAKGCEALLRPADAHPWHRAHARGAGHRAGACCFRLNSPGLGTLDVFRARTGIFAMHCYHFDAEDIQYIDSNTVRTCKLQGLEAGANQWAARRTSCCLVGLQSC